MSNGYSLSWSLDLGVRSTVSRSLRDLLTWGTNFVYLYRVICAVVVLFAMLDSDWYFGAGRLFAM